MTRKAMLLALAMLIVGIAIGGAISALASSPQQDRQEWEYYIPSCSDIAECESDLNSWGGSGYQLASTLFDGQSVYLFLMRPK